LDQAGVMKREVRNNPNKAQPGKKMAERAASRAETSSEATPEA
jgi:small subunit ribosomal protein S16